MITRDKLIIGIFLSAMCVSAFASRKTCEVDEWCAMPRAADIADIRIYSSDGVKYTCTLSVDGKYQANKHVQVNISGAQGFETAPMVMTAHQGGSTQIEVKGMFSDLNADPVIRIRRLVDDTVSSTNAVSYIMCSYR